MQGTKDTGRRASRSKSSSRSSSSNSSQNNRSSNDKNQQFDDKDDEDRVKMSMEPELIRFGTEEPAYMALASNPIEEEGRVAERKNGGAPISKPT